MSLSARRLVVGSAAVVLAAVLGVAFFVPSIAQPLGSNIIQLLSTASGVAPQLKAAGQDANISINAVPKGTGCFQVNGVCVTPGGAAPPLAGTFLTWTDQSATIPNSRNLIAGTNITFDDTVANVRTVNVPVTPGGVGIHGPCVATDVAVWFDGSNITCFADFTWDEVTQNFNVGPATTIDALAGQIFSVGAANSASAGTFTDVLIGFALVDDGGVGGNTLVGSSITNTDGDTNTFFGIALINTLGTSNFFAGTGVENHGGDSNVILAVDTENLGDSNLLVGTNLDNIGTSNAIVGLTLTNTNAGTMMVGQNFNSTTDDALELGYIGSAIVLTAPANVLTIALPGIRAAGAATGKRVVCIDNTTKILYTSSTGTDCSN